MMNSISMTQLAASVADAMGIEPPKEANHGIEQVAALVQNTFGKKADKVMIYNPDCISMWMYQKHTDLFAPVMAATQLTVPVATVMPSVTPVCFGTMYTGAMPAVHGIQSYTKPQITIDSLFDALSRAGKKVALVTVENSSMDLIFRGRKIDYFPMPYDGEATKKGLELIKEDRYDVVVVYNQEYDDMIHDTQPESVESMAALKKHVASFAELTDAVRQYWSGHDSMVVWATDHGVHTDWDGHGNHGEFREDDINVMHFYGAYPKR